MTHSPATPPSRPDPRETLAVVHVSDTGPAPPDGFLVEVPCPLCGSRERQELFRKTAHFWRRGTAFEHLFAVVRCLDCGLDHVHPRLRSDLLAHHYAAHDAYADLRESQLNARRAYFRETLATIEAARKRRRGRLLDVACSEGTFVAVARESGWDAEGIEISAPAAAHGREVLGLPIRTGRLEDTGLPGGSFDVVTVQSFLEHSEDPVLLFKEIHRILKPGGLLYANVCNGRSLAARMQGADWYNYDPVVHLSYFGPRTLRRLARQTGFTRLRVRSRGVGARFFQTAVADNPTARKLDDWYRDKGWSSPLVVRAKRLVSRGLSALGLGQTLILMARRPR